MALKLQSQNWLMVAMIRMPTSGLRVATGAQAWWPGDDLLPHNLVGRVNHGSFYRSALNWYDAIYGIGIVAKLWTPV
jgi:hypothetical protein